MMLPPRKLGVALFELSDRIDAIDHELETAEKAGAKPRADMADDLNDIAEGLAFYASLAQSNPSYSTYASYLLVSSGTCSDAADGIARIIKAGDVVGKGWGEALDGPVVLVAAAAAALPY